MLVTAYFNYHNIDCDCINAMVWWKLTVRHIKCMVKFKKSIKIDPVSVQRYTLNGIWVSTLPKKLSSTMTICTRYNRSWCLVFVVVHVLDLTNKIILWCGCVFGLGLTFLNIFPREIFLLSMILSDVSKLTRHIF